MTDTSKVDINFFTSTQLQNVLRTYYPMCLHLVYEIHDYRVKHFILNIEQLRNVPTMTEQILRKLRKDCYIGSNTGCGYAVFTQRFKNIYQAKKRIKRIKFCQQLHDHYEEYEYRPGHKGYLELTIKNKNKFADLLTT